MTEANGTLFQAASPEEFGEIRDFYWRLIDLMSDQNDKIGWKKGIYPTDRFLLDSLSRGELYTLRLDGALLACVILNSDCNEGYSGVPWSVDCGAEEVLIPHALAVDPVQQGKGTGTRLVGHVLDTAKALGKKAVRLDILGTNTAAEGLYTKCGFKFVQSKIMFYEDTGWTEYKMYEYVLPTV